MPDKSLKFSNEMLAAIVEGRKTQTRRPVKPQPIDVITPVGGFEWRDPNFYDPLYIDKNPHCVYGCKSPVGMVEELVHFPVKPKIVPGDKILARKPGRKWWDWEKTLLITRLRVERLDCITPDDIQAEGLPRTYAGGEWGEEELYERFAELWDSFYGGSKYEWNNNPWVWVYDFEVNNPFFGGGVKDEE